MCHAEKGVLGIGKHKWHSRRILDIGCVNPDTEHQTRGVYQQVAFPPAHA